MENFDIYAYIASKVFSRSYVDCCQFNDGREPYPFGKLHRDIIKEAFVEKVCNNKTTKMMSLIEYHFSGIIKFCDMNYNNTEFYDLLNQFIINFDYQC